MGVVNRTRALVVTAVVVLGAAAMVPRVPVVARYLRWRATYDRAQEAEAMGRWVEARELWKGCLRYKDAAARLSKVEARLTKHCELMAQGRTCLTRGRLEEAGRHFAAAGALLPSDESKDAIMAVARQRADHELALGRACILGYRLLEAARHFTNADRLCPSEETRRAAAMLAKLRRADADRFLASARRLLRNGRSDDAEVAFGKAAALCPGAVGELGALKRAAAAECLAEADRAFAARRTRAAVALLQEALKLTADVADNVDRRLARIRARDYPGAFGADGNWLIDRVMPVEEAMNQAVEMEFAGHPEPSQDDYGSTPEWVRASDRVDDWCLRRAAKRFGLPAKTVFEAHAKVTTIRQRERDARRRGQ